MFRANIIPNELNPLQKFNIACRDGLRFINSNESGSINVNLQINGVQVEQAVNLTIMNLDQTLITLPQYRDDDIIENHIDLRGTQLVSSSILALEKVFCVFNRDQ